MHNSSAGLIPVAARPSRFWLGVLAGVGVGESSVLTALGWIGSPLPPSVGLPTVPGLLFESPVLFPAALAAVGLVVASVAVRWQSWVVTPASLAGLAAVLLAQATVAWSSANLLIMYQESLYTQIMAGRPAGG